MNFIYFFKKGETIHIQGGGGGGAIIQAGKYLRNYGISL
jgi:hypothetical protein